MKAVVLLVACGVLTSIGVLAFLLAPKEKVEVPPAAVEAPVVKEAHVETREGESLVAMTPVVGLNAGALAAGVLGTPAGYETLDVLVGTSSMTVDVELAGLLPGESYSVVLTPPDCTSLDDCRISATTDTGTVSLSVGSPDPGAWTAAFFLDSSGADNVHYKLTLTTI